jgi:hypothetical protein
MKFVCYSAVVIGFLVGWVGTAIFVDRFIKELIPESYAEETVTVTVGWLQSPGSVLGLPVGGSLAYIIAAVLKRKGAR